MDRSELVQNVALSVRGGDHGLCRQTRHHGRGRVSQRKYRVSVVRQNMEIDGDGWWMGGTNCKRLRKNSYEIVPDSHLGEGVR